MRLSMPDLPDIDWQHHGPTIRTDIGLKVCGLYAELRIGRLSVMWNRRIRESFIRPGAERPAPLSEMEAGTLDPVMLVSLLNHSLTHWLLNRDPECKWCR